MSITVNEISKILNQLYYNQRCELNWMVEVPFAGSFVLLFNNIFNTDVLIYPGSRSKVWIYSSH